LISFQGAYRVALELMMNHVLGLSLIAALAQGFIANPHFPMRINSLKRVPPALAVRIPASPGVVVYTTTSCSFCKKAKKTLDGLGASYTEVQLDKDKDGTEIRAALQKKTGRSSVPSIWIKGQFVGGMNDGGPAGGLGGLVKGDMLVPMLQKAGAMKKDVLDRSPLAPLRGNNLRDALGSISGATGQMRSDVKQEEGTKKKSFWG